MNRTRSVVNLKTVRKWSSPAMVALGVFAVAGVVLLLQPSAQLRPSPVDNSVAVGAPSDSALDTAVVRALVVHQQVYASSGNVLAVTPALRQLSSSAKLATAVAPDGVAANEQRLRAAKSAQIGQYFGSGAAVLEASSADAVQKADQDPNFRSLDGGVSSVDITSRDIAGNHATVKLTAAVWTSMAQRQPNGTWVTATPHGSLNVVMGLDLSSAGAWVVSTFTWTFAPGSEP